MLLAIWLPDQNWSSPPTSPPPIGLSTHASRGILISPQSGSLLLYTSTEVIANDRMMSEHLQSRLVTHHSPWWCELC